MRVPSSAKAQYFSVQNITFVFFFCTIRQHQLYFHCIFHVSPNNNHKKISTDLKEQIVRLSDASHLMITCVFGSYCLFSYNYVGHLFLRYAMHIPVHLICSYVYQKSEHIGRIMIIITNLLFPYSANL